MSFISRDPAKFSWWMGIEKDSLMALAVGGGNPNPCVILPKSSPCQRTSFQGKVLSQSTILKLLLQLEEGHFSPLKAPPALDRLQGNYLEMLQPEKQLGIEEKNYATQEIFVKVTTLRNTTILRFYQKIIEWSPSPHLSPPPPPCTNTVNTVTVDYSFLSCKMQTLSEEDYIGKPEVEKGDKNKNTGRTWSFRYLHLEQTLTTA